MITTEGNCVHVTGESVINGIAVERDECGSPRLPIGNLEHLLSNYPDA